jgi:hypothetical protein
MFYRDYRADEVEAAVELALEKSISTSDGVLHILIYTNGDITAFTPLSGWPSLPPPDIAIYGQLGGVQ